MRDIDDDPQPHREHIADDAYAASLARARGADMVRKAVGWGKNEPEEEVS